MITWGISANSHNAALAVFNDDNLVFASESERYTKIKNDPHLCFNLIQEAIYYGGQPDLICWYENPLYKTARQLFAGQGWNYSENNIKKYLKSHGITAPIWYSKHHLSHAAAGYYTSEFDDSCVVVIDSIGEFETLTMWQGKGDRLKNIFNQSYPHSVGLWYSAMTQRCGLKPNEEEYILMGMAAYGDPNRLYNEIRSMVKFNHDDELFPYLDEYPFIHFRKNFHRGILDWRPDLNSQQDLFDIAAATQRVYEEILANILFFAAKLTKNKNLVLMGGCALNCSANKIAYKYFENVWIMPAPGDNGSSIGAVLAYKKKHIKWTGPYLGHNIFASISNDKIVDHLLTEKICGVARGRAEFGPRALGNRSLIADPRDASIRDLVNNIKQRQQFRPFAPAILEEFADRYFKMPTRRTPYMQYTAECRNPKLFPGIVHQDGTSRVQTVSEKDNPLFRDLLEKWFVRTGCPMLLNTSLNIKGQPIVNDIADAKAWSDTYGLPIFT